MQNGKRLPASVILRTGAPPDWERLVPGEPERVVDALRSWIGAQRSADPETEHGYWETLIARYSADEVAEAVLERLDLDAHLLLDLDAGDVAPLREHLEGSAREHLERLNLPAGESERVRRHPVLLAEVACEAPGRWSLAAALYALAHAARAGNDSVSRYEEILLRFKLGNALHLLDERPDSRRRSIALVQRAADIAGEAETIEDVTRDAMRALELEIRIWLGHRQEELGDLEAAATSFRAAVGCSRTPDDRVTCAARAASVLAACGRAPEARELLLSVRDDVWKVEDDLVCELWEAVLWRLEEGE